MPDKNLGIVDTWANRRALRFWRNAAKAASDADLSALRQARSGARAMRGHIETFLSRADERLALPNVGSQAFPRPADADWAWRPEVWRGPLPTRGISSAVSRAKLGDEITLFHDCSLAELTLRQLRNLRQEDLAPFGLRLEVFGFDGSFLSLVVDLPTEMAEGLQKTHLIRMDCIVELEHPIEIFARLNVKHGPNTEQTVRELPLHEDSVMVEFDLAYTNLNEKRVERAWVDIIFESPRMNQIVLRDVTFSRRPRAAL